MSRLHFCGCLVCFIAQLTGKVSDNTFCIAVRLPSLPHHKDSAESHDRVPAGANLRPAALLLVPADHQPLAALQRCRVPGVQTLQAGVGVCRLRCAAKGHVRRSVQDLQEGANFR